MCHPMIDKLESRSIQSHRQKFSNVTTLLSESYWDPSKCTLFTTAETCQFELCQYKLQNVACKICQFTRIPIRLAQKCRLCCKTYLSVRRANAKVKQ